MKNCIEQILVQWKIKTCGEGGVEEFWMKKNKHKWGDRTKRTV
jgi:hypothetical protein